MKNLLACLAVFTVFGAGAQSMPYNPDANDDGYIGSPDLLSFLPLFGSQVGIDSSLTCDYDGTPIEEFFGNVWNGDIVIDSMLVQYHTIDSAEVYIAGCPDPIWETVSYERAWITDHYSEGTNIKYWRIYQPYYRHFALIFNASDGYFEFRIKDDEVNLILLDQVLGSHSATAWIEEGSGCWFLPFPTDAAAMDENGIHFEYWSNFLSGTTYVNIIPYWHYAE